MRHHQDFKARAEQDDAAVASFAGPGRRCLLCDGTGHVADQPCCCPSGRAVLAEADEWPGPTPAELDALDREAAREDALRSRFPERAAALDCQASTEPRDA